jgi:hypothetical protein
MTTRVGQWEQPQFKVDLSMPLIANGDAAARRGTRREAAGSPTMDGPGLARRVKADLRAQELRRVLVDQAVLRQLAGLSLGPDEEAERVRRRDTAERELAGSRAGLAGSASITQSDYLGTTRSPEGVRPRPEMAEAGLPSARGDPAAQPAPRVILRRSCPLVHGRRGGSCRVEPHEPSPAGRPLPQQGGQDALGNKHHRP